ncbi:MAG: adenylate/guanylate cyclase domain-containing protein [Dehalococcoidia bacterium]|nr:alpha/beta fold hydrolase [Chloroflexi bacterium CFX7]MCK6563566.1 adenylate/guanylate cyclase domain-containing protein [Dehalococcoidia bacterium]MCL4232545.1 adenylate/guanylate cyclase domain-containing protein [Dehalococcoidia bacterium]NUQ56081.1 adenylate/guanylate cyclase domain-containing protein [Dehalococcoidia bacterium]RIL02986.1 MAG: hypothetical protein DCC78_05965 [bacterium]
MGEPRIRYLTSGDGVNIAYWAEGEGRTVIHMPPMPWSHLQVEWEGERQRAWYQALIARCRLVRYDNRGSGLSDRGAENLGLQAHIGDLTALVERLGTGPVALIGVSFASPVAIAFAASHPELVSHLVLWCGFANAIDSHIPQLAAMGPMFETDWPLATETVAHALVAGWDAPDEARHFAAMMREASDREGTSKFFSAFDTFDVTADLGRITCPVLVLQRRGARVPDPAVSRKLAAMIPGAQLTALEGESVLPWVGNTAQLLETTADFLGLRPAETAPSAAAVATAGALRTILFTDIEGHTAMMQRLGDAEGRSILRQHERITREALREFAGSEVKTMGDGFMASFGSAQRALECAIALQRRLTEAASRLPFVLRIRVGLNAGEPIAEEDDLFGASVIAAARIAAHADGGEILVSNVVRELAAGKGFVFSERGETVLRGFDDPVRLFELRWQEG